MHAALPMTLVISSLPLSVALLANSTFIGFKLEQSLPAIRLDNSFDDLLQSLSATPNTALQHDSNVVSYGPPYDNQTEDDQVTLPEGIFENGMNGFANTRKNKASVGNTHA